MKLLSLQRAAVLTALAIMLLVCGIALSLTGVYAGDSVTFTRHSVDNACGSAFAVYPADLDGDGDLDVIGGGGLIRNEAHNDDFAWWENNGMLTFIRHSIDEGFESVRSVWAEDLDCDGYADVLATAYWQNQIAWWKNEPQPDGTVVFTKHIIDGGFYRAHFVSVEDVDRDGDPDVLGAAPGADTIAWWENEPQLDATLVLTKHVVSDQFDGAYTVYAGDLDDDGDMDILGAAYGQHEIAWWKNDGDQNSTKQAPIESGYLEAHYAYPADIDDDGDLDIIGTVYLLGDVSWWRNDLQPDGTGTFTKQDPIDNQFDGAHAVHVGDIDQDGDLDIVGSAHLADAIAWWENMGPQSDGTLGFTKHVFPEVVDGAGGVYAIDLDSDRDLDILSAALHAHEISWWENTMPSQRFFVVLGQEGIWLKQGASVTSGDIGANIDSEGPYLSDGVEVAIGYGVLFSDSSSRLMGDSIKLKDNAQVYDVYYNELSGLGDVLGEHHTPVDLPLVDAFPDVPSFAPGTEDVDVPKNGTRTLEPGSYGALDVRNGSTITLTGGVYDFAEWNIGDNVNLYFGAPTEIRIADKLATGQGCYIGPAPQASGLGAKDVIIYVMGENGSTGKLGGTPKAAKLGIGNTVYANIYVPNGTLRIREQSAATGSFLGRWIVIGYNVTVTLDSGW
jgi:hypothetical protein